MQLDQYISDLLYRYECVIVPEFGAFLTQYKSAQVHETTHAFYPPQKIISFNAQLIDNDGLLANYIATADAITYQEAMGKIQSYVRKVWDGLHKGDATEVHNVGVLKLNADRALQFEPSYHLNYLTSSFGLSSFTSPSIAREVYKKQVQALEEKAPIAISPERRSNGWLKYAAIALIALSVAGLGGYNYSQNVEAHNLAAQDEATEQLQNKIQEATFIIDNPLPAITLEFTQPKGNYHIVGGAFRAEENAQKRVEQLQAKGYNARQIGTNNYGLHQVVYDSYSDSQEALAALRKVRKEDNHEAWLLVKKID